MPVDNCDQLKAEVASTKDDDQARKQYLIKRAVDLGCLDEIPDEWEMELDDE